MIAVKKDVLNEELLPVGEVLHFKALLSTKWLDAKLDEGCGEAGSNLVFRPK